MNTNIMKLLVTILLINALVKSQPLEPAGKLRPTTAAKPYVRNPFTPNSAIFKIPVSKTVNLDFKNASISKINSDLLTVLKDLLQNKTLKQEKLILNVKPPKGSNSSFTKTFTSLLRTETTYVVPDAVVGAQSTVFKKKNGEIINLRLTLYVIRQKRVIPIRKPLKLLTSRKVIPPQLSTEKAYINTTKVENITATVETVLRQLYENSTENRAVNKTDIFLNLISSTNFTSSKINSLKSSIKQISEKLYPNSIISIKTGLTYRRIPRTSKLEFEIDIQPRSSDSSTKLATNKLKTIINKTEEAIWKQPKNVSKPEGNTKDADKKQPKNTSKKTQEAPQQKLNVTVVSTSEETDQSVQQTLNTLKKDLQELIPDTWLILQVRKVISEDLNHLSNALKYREEEPNRLKIVMDLTKSGASIENEFDKQLPHLLKTVNETLKPVVLSLRIAIPNDSKENSINSDICSLLKTLTSRIPRKTRFGDLDIEVTLSPNSSELIPIKPKKVTPVSANIKSPSKSASSTSPHLPTITFENLLNLTEPGIDITHKINEHVRHLPFENNPDNQLNISLIIPQNETNLFVTYILNIMREDLKILLPYSQILIQNQDLVAKDLRILRLSIQLRDKILRRKEKNTQVLQIDLSALGQNVPKEVTDLIEPLWPNITEEKSTIFDLKLRPVNDIDRRRLGNDLCSIVDVLTKSLPKELSLNDIILQTTILPAESSKVSSEESKKHEVPQNVLELVDPGKTKTKNIDFALNELVKESQNSDNPFISTNNANLQLQVPEYATRENIEQTIRIIKKDLQKLSSYANVLFKTQKSIKDELHTLEQTKQIDSEKPIKKFEIDLNKFGEFLPEQVDEVVYDIRNIQRPFSFSLKIVIPQKVDLESASSEICSVSNVVINNIAKQSYLTGTFLRVSVSSKIEKIKPLKTQEIYEKPSPRSSQIVDILPPAVKSKIAKISGENKESIPPNSEEERKIPNNSEEEINISKTVTKSKISKSPNINKYLTSSTFIPLRKPVLVPSYQRKQIKPFPEVVGEVSSQKPHISTTISKVTAPKIGHIKTSTEESIPNNAENSEPSSTDIYEGPTSNCVIPEYISSTSESSISQEEEEQPKNKNIQNNNETDEEDENNEKETEEQKNETESSEQEDEAEVNTSEIEPKGQEITKVVQKLPPTKKVSRISKGLQGIKQSILNGIGSLSSAVKSIVQGRQTENLVSTEIPSISTPSTNEIFYNKKKISSHTTMSVPRNLETTKAPKITDIVKFMKKRVVPPKNIPQIKSVTENIPLSHLYPETPNKIISFLRNSVTRSTIEPQIKTKTKNIRVASSYPKTSDEIKNFLSKIAPAFTNPSQISLENGNIPINSYPQTTEKSILAKKISYSKKTPQIQHQIINIPFPSKTFTNIISKLPNQQKPGLVRKSLYEKNSATENSNQKEYASDLTSSNEYTESAENTSENERQSIEVPSVSISKYRLPKNRIYKTQQNTKISKNNEIIENQSTEAPSAISKILISPSTKTVNIKRRYRGRSNNNEIIENLSTEAPSATSKTLKSPSTKSVKTKRTYRGRNNKLENETSSIPPFNKEKIKKIPIRALNNDKNYILQYIENLDLSKSGPYIDETILNLATYVIDIIPWKENETLELILNIKPPHNTTVDTLKKITNSVHSSLLSLFPNDIVNIGTKVTKNRDNVVIRTQMKITISKNDDIIWKITNQENLENKVENESRMVQNLSQILDALTRNVKQELHVQNHLESVNNKTELKYQTSFDEIESFLKQSLHSIVSDILGTIDNSSEPQNLNFSYSVKAPAVVNQKVADHFSDLLQTILVNDLPFEDIATEAKSLKNESNTVLLLRVNIKPRTIFTTSPINLDDLNILDVESVLTKIISNYITRLGNANVYKNRIVIVFIFETSRISSLNLENIESAIDDVFSALNLKGVLLTKEIKLGLTKKNEIVINLPYTISTLNFIERSAPQGQQEVKTPKPLEMISDLILGI